MSRPRPEPLPERLLLALEPQLRALSLWEVVGLAYGPRRGGGWSMDRRGEATEWALRELVRDGLVHECPVAVEPPEVAYILTGTGRWQAQKLAKRNQARLVRASRR